jgi:hypothetical protein
VAEIQIERIPNVPEGLLRLSINGAVFSGHDRHEFPDVTALFPTGEPVARARFGTLEPVLVAATTDETRKAMNAVFFQLCRTSRSQRTVTSSTPQDRQRGKGDFWSRGRPSSSSRTSARPPGPVRWRSTSSAPGGLRVGRFEVASRLETEKFPAWEEVLPKESKYELRLSKCALLEARSDRSSDRSDREASACAAWRRSRDQENPTPAR